MLLRLQKERFMALLRQYQAEEEAAGRHHGWQTRLATAVGSRQSSISGLLREREPGPKLIEGAIEKMRVSRDFFTDPTLGKSPNYRDFIGKKPIAKPVVAVTESRVSYDGNADYPTAVMREEFLETLIGRKTDPDDYDEILYTKYEGGASLGKMMDTAGKKHAQRRGKAVNEPEQKTKIAENKMALAKPTRGR